MHIEHPIKVQFTTYPHPLKRYMHFHIHLSSAKAIVVAISNLEDMKSFTIHYR